MIPSDIVSNENLDVETGSVMEQRSLFEEFTYLNYLNDYPHDSLLAQVCNLCPYSNFDHILKYL